MKIYIRIKQIKSIILCAFVYAILFMLSSCTPTVNSTKKDDTPANPSAPYSKKIGSI